MSNKPERVDDTDYIGKGADTLRKTAKNIEETGMGVETLANLAYNLRSKRLQNIFDWFSEDSQRDLLRADDRTFFMKFFEKWLPELDYKRYNFPKEAFRNVLVTLASVGMIDVKPEILKDMRGFAGTGFMQIPDGIFTIILEVLGIPEAIPIIKAVKAVGKTGESLSKKIRAKVAEKVGAAEVESTQKVEHDEEIHAAGMDKMKNAVTSVASEH